MKKLTGNNFWEFVENFKKLQFAKPELLTERAEKRISNLLVHAYNNIPFYQESFKSHGVTPHDFHNIEDLQQFPILTKTDIRNNYLNLLKARNISEDRFVLTRTSGSTGMPTQFFVDKSAFHIKQASRFLFDYWAGIRPASRRVWLSNPRIADNLSNSKTTSVSLMSTIKKMGGRIITGAEDIYHIPSFNIDYTNVVEIIKDIIEFNPDYIHTYASIIAKLSKKMKKLNMPPPPNLKTIIITADTITPTELDIVKEVYNCNIVNRYGCWECGDALAQSCSEDFFTLHVNSELVFIEVVGADGKKVKPGERGKILITDYYNYAMPFIRYEIGDYAILGKSCNLGISFPVLDRIEGRSIEFILTPSGKSISPIELGGYFFKLKDYHLYIKEYQAIQYALEYIDFLIIPDKNYNVTIEKRLYYDLNSFIGEDVKVNIKIVLNIEPEKSGKRLIIKSMLNKKP